MLDLFIYIGIPILYVAFKKKFRTSCEKFGYYFSSEKPLTLVARNIVNVFFFYAHRKRKDFIKLATNLDLRQQHHEAWKQTKTTMRNTQWWIFISRFLYSCAQGCITFQVMSITKKKVWEKKIFCFLCECFFLIRLFFYYRKQKINNPLYIHIIIIYIYIYLYTIFPYQQCRVLFVK